MPVSDFKFVVCHFVDLKIRLNDKFKLFSLTLRLIILYNISLFVTKVYRQIKPLGYQNNPDIALSSLEGLIAG